MPLILVALLFLIVFLFSLASVSQSYATAKQAQAAIEASRAAQIASTGNLVTLMTIALVVVAVLAAVILIAWLLLRAKPQTSRQWSSNRNNGWDQFQQPDANALVPALMTLLLYEMTQHQSHPVETAWLNEPALSDLPTFPDNTWDL